MQQHRAITVLRFLTYLVFLISASMLSAGEKKIDSVLVLGPLSQTGHIDQAASKKYTELKQNLVSVIVDKGMPSAGDAFHFFDQELSWKKTTTAKLASLAGDGLLIVSFNMTTDRYTEGSLQLKWNGEADLYGDGVKIGGSIDGGFSIKAPTGTQHLVFVLKKGEGDQEPGLAWKSDLEGASFSIEPKRLVSAEQLFETPTVGNLQVSPNGKWVLLGTRGWNKASGAWENRVELRTADGQVKQQWQSGAPSGFAWSDDSNHIAYRTGNDVWVESTATGQARRVLSNVKGLGGFGWAPDGKSLFFNWSTDGKKDISGFKRYQALEDRWGGWRDRSQIYQVDLESGFIRQLTEGEDSHGIMDIHPDGKRLLVTKNPVDYKEPSHILTVLMELDIASGQLTELGQYRAFNTAAYGPNGLYVLGGPSAFDGAGSVLDKATPPNDYDAQLYHFNPQTGQAKALSRDFDPSINNMTVLPDGNLLLVVTEKEETNAYMYHVDEARFQRMASPATVLDTVSVSKEKDPTVYWAGTSVTTPQKVFRSKLGQWKPEPWFDPSNGVYDQTVFGEVKPFTFKNKDGLEIDGRFYTPPGFDPEKKYPLIVYYYGGTVPVGEAFTGRYPFNLWAANGYVVYIVQPAGAVGYGQAFSAKHVNAWGKETADEIIAGTKAFLKAHSFTDPARVGCGGASYGGFMTMYLVTRTDIFSAAISHAGISSLTGYWGKGWWGYTYNGVAGRNSFPWNNRDLYVEQSPVYSADKVTTPLLLLHGDADTNVPPEQSHVMYTALKLLDKEVELITIDDQDHWILQHDQRYIWWDTILAWFDKHLKDQPQWWTSIYP